MVKRMFQDVSFPSKDVRKVVPSKDFSSQSEHVEKEEKPLFRKWVARTPSYSSLNFKMNPSGWIPRTRLVVWGVAVLALVLTLFSVFSFFEKAIIKITPKQEILALNTPLSASRGTGAPGGLVFEIMTLKGEEKKVLPATQVERVDKEASGKIIIYNNFSSENQQLIKRTRFETSQGLVYRIRNPIMVPGQKVINGKKVPGSVEVTVYADEPGEKYNISVADFSIPGFKGSPRFEGFYGRSQAPMTGGFSGIVKTVSDEQLKKVEGEMEETLRTKLLQKAYSQKPENFILYDNAIFFVLDEGGARALETNVDKNEVTVVVSGTLNGIIFNDKILSQFLAHVLGLPVNEAVTIRNLDSLNFSIPKKDQFSPTENTSLSFLLQGSPYVVWEFNGPALIKDTLGKSKEEFKVALSKYQSIQKAEVVLRPFWKGVFPNDPQRIVIETIINEK